MDTTRFLSILNRALGESGLDLANPGVSSDPRTVAAWAGFLRRCVAEGVSIADPRWRDLELRSRQGVPVLVLGPEAARGADDGKDFTLGLSLLMSMLGQSTRSDDC